MNSKVKQESIMEDTREENKLNKSVGLKRTIGLSSGISIIVGCIIGSGIFVSPKSVLVAANSIGLSLIIWVLCGVVSLLAALCYAEIGTIIPDSGAELSYILIGFSTINEQLGRFLGFLFTWSMSIISGPSSFAALALACSWYTISPIMGSCEPPENLIKLGAIVVMLLASALNGYSITLTNKVLTVLSFAKVAALILISIGGIVRLFQGYTKNFQNSFEGSTTNILTIAGGFYGGLWSFSGWNNLNCVTEEVKNPKRNLPLSIVISLILCLIVYILTNISYFTVMSKDELIASNTVAVTWSDAVLVVYFKWIIPVSVALSTFSAGIATMYGLIRINYVAARQGLLPNTLVMLNVKRNTPLVSIIFTFILGLLFLIPSDLDRLIGIVAFTNWIFVGLTITSLVITRFTMRTVPRIIKLPLIIPIFMIIVAIYLTVAPVISDPKIEFLGSLAIIFVGILLYIPFIYFKLKIPYFTMPSKYMNE